MSSVPLKWNVFLSNMCNFCTCCFWLGALLIKRIKSFWNKWSLLLKTPEFQPFLWCIWQNIFSWFWSGKYGLILLMPSINFISVVKDSLTTEISIALIGQRNNNTVSLYLIPLPDGKKQLHFCNNYVTKFMLTD